MIDEEYLLEINKLQTKDVFNSHAKRGAQLIALRFIKKNCFIDYDLVELVIIKLYHQRIKLDSTNLPDYKSFNNRFKDWIYIAIQDLGRTDLANKFNYKAMLIIKINNTQDE